MREWGSDGGMSWRVEELAGAGAFEDALEQVP